MHWMVDFEDGEMVVCPTCKGWDESETGCRCLACDGEGVVWEPLPDNTEDRQGGA